MVEQLKSRRRRQGKLINKMVSRMFLFAIVSLSIYCTLYAEDLEPTSYITKKPAEMIRKQETTVAFGPIPENDDDTEVTGKAGGDHHMEKDSTPGPYVTDPKVRLQETTVNPPPNKNHHDIITDDSNEPEEDAEEFLQGY